MTAHSDLEIATQTARRLTEIEARRYGLSKTVARNRVAKREKIAPGTLENLLKHRSKSVAGWVRDALQAALIREIQNEINRLEHELQITRLSSVGPSDVDVVAAETALAAAREAIKGVGKCLLG